MAALLVALTVMAVTLSVALPVWKTAVQREKEAELIFRGQQYARAVALFQRKYANAFPANIDALVSGRFLRRKYLDPMTNGEFQVLYGSAQQTVPGQGGGPAPMPGQGGAPGQIAPGPQRPGQQPAPRPGAPTPGRPAVPGGPPGQPSPGGSAGPVGAQQGIVGVASKSTAASLRIYNGRTKYNEWAFLAQEVTKQPGAVGGTQKPGAPAGASPRPGTPSLPVRPTTPSPTFPRRP